MLKPCPFCGAKGRTLKHVSPGQLGRFDDDTGQTAIVCDCNDYGCGAMGVFRNSSQEAEESWNTRQDSDLLEALKKIIDGCGPDSWEGQIARAAIAKAEIGKGGE